jgi:hypothetical protein
VTQQVFQINLEKIGVAVLTIRYYIFPHENADNEAAGWTGGLGAKRIAPRSPLEICVCA